MRGSYARAARRGERSQHPGVESIAFRPSRERRRAAGRAKMLPVRPRRPTAEQALLAAVLALGALPRVFLALTDDGIYWPDEIYQTLEPAHRLVFGYGL